MSSAGRCDPTSARKGPQTQDTPARPSARFADCTRKLNLRGSQEMNWKIACLISDDVRNYEDQGVFGVRTESSEHQLLGDFLRYCRDSR